MITANELIFKVVELVIKNPNYIYHTNRLDRVCVYVAEDNADACIFGQALAELGVSLDGMKHHQVGIVNVCNELGIEHTQDQGFWMEGMQSYQDKKYPWRRALAIVMQDWPGVVIEALKNASFPDLNEG